MSHRSGYDGLVGLKGREGEKLKVRNIRCIGGKGEFV